MRLCSDIGNSEEHVPGELALNRKVVLLGVLRLQVRLKFTKEQKWPERGPVHAAWRPGTPCCDSTGCLRGLIDNAHEWIWRRAAALKFERGVEFSLRKERTAAKWWLRAELFEHQLFDRIIKDAEASPNTHFSGAARNFGDQSIAGSRAIGDADAGSKRLVVRCGQAAWNARVAGEYQAKREHGIVSIRGRLAAITRL